MKLLPLFRSRVVMLPTLTGMFVILFIIGLVGTILFRNIALFLTVNEPLGADTLVIEGWMGKEELEQALVYFNAKGYSRAIIVGGPISNDFHGIDTNFAERAAGYLQSKGLPVDKTVVITSPWSAQNRTFLNAVMTRDWLSQTPPTVRSLDIFSSHLHTRRSRYLFQLAFGDAVEIGVVPSVPANFDPEHWWRSSASGKYVAVEFAGWVMTRCCFNPGEPGSHFERWGIDK